jgi:hypothetical protein
VGESEGYDPPRVFKTSLSKPALQSLLGEAVQLELMKPKLIAPGTARKRSRLKYYNMLLCFACIFNLRRYS